MNEVKDSEKCPYKNTDEMISNQTILLNENGKVVSSDYKGKKNEEPILSYMRKIGKFPSEVEAEDWYKKCENTFGNIKEIYVNSNKGITAFNEYDMFKAQEQMKGNKTREAINSYDSIIKRSTTLPSDYWTKNAKQLRDLAVVYLEVDNDMAKINALLSKTKYLVEGSPDSFRSAYSSFQDIVKNKQRILTELSVSKRNNGIKVSYNPDRSQMPKDMVVGERSVGYIPVLVDGEQNVGKYGDLSNDSTVPLLMYNNTNRTNTVWNSVTNFLYASILRDRYISSYDGTQTRSFSMNGRNMVTEATKELETMMVKNVRLYYLEKSEYFKNIAESRRLRAGYEYIFFGNGEDSENMRSILIQTGNKKLKYSGSEPMGGTVNLVGNILEEIRHRLLNAIKRVQQSEKADILDDLYYYTFITYRELKKLLLEGNDLSEFRGKSIVEILKYLKIKDQVDYELTLEKINSSRNTNDPDAGTILNDLESRFGGALSKLYDSRGDLDDYIKSNYPFTDSETRNLLISLFFNRLPPKNEVILAYHNYRKKKADYERTKRGINPSILPDNKHIEIIEILAKNDEINEPSQIVNCVRKKYLQQYSETVSNRKKQIALDCFLDFVMDKKYLKDENNDGNKEYNFCTIYDNRLEKEFQEQLAFLRQKLQKKNISKEKYDWLVAKGEERKEMLKCSKVNNIRKLIRNEQMRRYTYAQLGELKKRVYDLYEAKKHPHQERVTKLIDELYKPTLQEISDANKMCALELLKKAIYSEKNNEKYGSSEIFLISPNSDLSPFNELPVSINNLVYPSIAVSVIATLLENIINLHIINRFKLPKSKSGIPTSYLMLIKPDSLKKGEIGVDDFKDMEEINKMYKTISSYYINQISKIYLKRALWAKFGGVNQRVFDNWKYNKLTDDFCKQIQKTDKGKKCENIMKNVQKELSIILIETGQSSLKYTNPYPIFSIENDTGIFLEQARSRLNNVNRIIRLRIDKETLPGENQTINFTYINSKGNQIFPSQKIVDGVSLFTEAGVYIGEVTNTFPKQDIITMDVYRKIDENTILISGEPTQNWIRMRIYDVIKTLLEISKNTNTPINFSFVVAVIDVFYNCMIPKENIITPPKWILDDVRNQLKNNTLDEEIEDIEEVTNFIARSVVRLMDYLNSFIDMKKFDNVPISEVLNNIINKNTPKDMSISDFEKHTLSVMNKINSLEIINTEIDDETLLETTFKIIGCEQNDSETESLSIYNNIKLVAENIYKKISHSVMLRSQIYCKDKLLSQSEIFYPFIIVKNPKKSIQETLSDISKPEIEKLSPGESGWDDNDCSDGEKSIPKTKKTFTCLGNNTLIFSIQRNKFSAAKNKKSIKIDRNIVATNCENQNINLTLRSCIVHSGDDVNSGHYYSLIFTDSDAILVADDLNVPFIKPANDSLLKDLSKNVTMCFYQQDNIPFINQMDINAINSNNNCYMNSLFTCLYSISVESVKYFMGEDVKQCNIKKLKIQNSLLSNDGQQDPEELLLKMLDIYTVPQNIVENISKHYMSCTQPKELNRLTYFAKPDPDKTDRRKIKMLKSTISLQETINKALQNEKDDKISIF